MKEFQTTNGFTVIVDGEDYALISQYNWRAVKRGNGWYPMTTAAAFQRSLGRNPKHDVFLHWMILPPKQGCHVDHINRNPLDNRRCNLRYTTVAQNRMNASRRRDNKSGYKGVSWNQARKHWQAEICFDYKSIYLGLYKTAEEGARAYDRKAVELFGEYAALNFPDGG